MDAFLEALEKKTLMRKKMLGDVHPSVVEQARAEVIEGIRRLNNTLTEKGDQIYTKIIDRISNEYSMGDRVELNEIPELREIFSLEIRKDYRILRAMLRSWVTQRFGTNVAVEGDVRDGTFHFEITQAS
jgi:hypothetical protein